MIPHEQEWAGKTFILHDIYPHTEINQAEQKGMMFLHKEQLEEENPALVTHYIYDKESSTYALYRQTG